jgi:peptidoglycan/LPS O-acetylase OafA/YrhL
MSDSSTVAADPTERAPGRYYRPELDLLRFAAFMMVYVSHAFPQRKGASHLMIAIKRTGSLGVPVFFALSAFLITELLLKEKSTTGSVDVKAFYARRILRIWPLYFAAIFLAYALSFLVPSADFTFAALAAYVLLVGNWYSILHGFLPLGFGTVWSICLEEQFYLVWPSVARLSSRRGLWIISASIWSFCQVVILILCYRHAAISPTIWINSFTQFQYFALGTMLCLVLRGSPPAISNSIRVGMVLCGLCILFTANFVFNTYMYEDGAASVLKTYPGYLISGAGVALLLLGFLGMSVPRSLSPGVYLGKISYGLYMIHHPLLLGVTELANGPLHRFGPPTLTINALTLPLTILLGSLSYDYFEKPFLRLKERFTVIKSRAV